MIQPISVILETVGNTEVVVTTVKGEFVGPPASYRDIQALIGLALILLRYKLLVTRRGSGVNVEKHSRRTENRIYIITTGSDAFLSLIVFQLSHKSGFR